MTKRQSRLIFRSFFGSSGGMVQIIDGHVTIQRARSGGEMILDLRVLDSSFAFVETDNELLLRAFEMRLTGARKSDSEL